MLKELKCDYFREKVIRFSEGLNIVVGDNKASNSIGKSTFLMILDFVFGGDTFLRKNSGAITALGNHAYFFKFDFDRSYYFCRETHENDSLYECDSNYARVQKISLEDYRGFLLINYHLEGLNLSFRETVGLFSRIWNKENDNVTKPLQHFNNDKDKNGVLLLIKLFNKYDVIKFIDEQLKLVVEKNKIFSSAQKKNFIPLINKTKYKSNGIRIQELDSIIKDIRNNYIKYALNINEFVAKDLFDLKSKRDELFKSKISLQNKITRIDQQLKINGFAKSKFFNKLDHFFDNVNYQKILEVEEFHSEIAKILNSELRQQKYNLENSLFNIDVSIDKIDIEVSNLVKGDDDSSKLIERVYEYTIELNELKRVNDFFNQREQIKGEVAEKKKEYSEKVAASLEEIEGKINEELVSLNDIVHKNTRIPPLIVLQKDGYLFNIQNDTGTGKAFVNLILFDLAILKQTCLPFLIHDSFLFKNIENNVIENLIETYNKFKKQIFISIDEVEKYSKKCQKTILDNECLRLTNEQLLFIKDWRDTSNL